MPANLIIGCEGIEPVNTLTVGVVCRGILTRHDIGKLEKYQKIIVMGTCPDYESCRLSLWTMCQQRKVSSKCPIKTD